MVKEAIEIMVFDVEVLIFLIDSTKDFMAHKTKEEVFEVVVAFVETIPVDHFITIEIIKATRLVQIGTSNILSHRTFRTKRKEYNYSALYYWSL